MKKQIINFEGDLKITGVPIIKANCNGKKIYLIIDTGATSSLIATEACADLGVIVQNASEKISGVNSESAMYQCNAIFDIGVPIYEVKAKSLGSVISAIRSRCGIRICGVIGSDALNNNKLIVDFSARQIQY